MITGAGANRLATNASGQVLQGEPSAYYPYGELRYGQPAGFRRFTGQHFDVEADLYYYGARFYDGALGRFISPDTIVPEPGNPQALNRYSYALNRPTVLVDPTGHSACALPHPGALVICSLGEQIMRYGPQIIQLIQQLTISAPQAPAMVDMATRTGQASQPASSNAGNTAGPGGLDPNDPRFTDIVQASQRFASIGREVVPNVLDAYGGKVGRSGSIPDAFIGRRVTTIGRWAQTEPAEKTGARILNVQDWSPRLNSDWIQEAIRNGDVFRLVTDVSDDTASLLNSNPLYKISAFARELDALLGAGYTRVGDYLVPRH